MFSLDGIGAATKLRSYRRAAMASLAGLAIAGMSAPSVSAAETRSYVVSWFTEATYSQAGDCPEGEHAFNELMETYRTELRGRGFSKEQIEDFVEHVDANRGRNPALTENRSTIDGKLVNSFANPTATPLNKEYVPRLPPFKSRFAYGFNLDGKGAASPDSFEDPETHETGINDAFYRATGCVSSFRATPPVRSLTGWAYQWQQVRDSMPAWIVSVSGADLTKDGAATVTFDRAIEHADVDAKGEVRTGATFRISPDTRSHNVFHGKIRKGVLTVEPGHLFMIGDPYLVPEVEIRNVHMRLSLKPDGMLDGMLGGYTPWLPMYWGIASGGRNLELPTAMDLVAYYHTLRQLADADPDPATGRNTSISVTFHVEAVPAFAVPAIGNGAKTAQAP